MAILGLLFAIWGGSLALWWNLRTVRFAGFAIALVLVAVAAWPGRQADIALLRANYVRSLVSYEGTKYVWGGENRLGIDCSGLVRRGLIDASLGQGLKTANPGLIRQSFLMRWFDCSAHALQKEYRGQTHRLFASPSIQQIDPGILQPGDIAVTATGIHTLAYLGDQTWIEADPGAGRVIKVRASGENEWLKMPVDILRWRAFEIEDQSRH